MTESSRKPLENLIPIATAKLAFRRLPEDFETYRNELHREMATHWPVRSDVSEGPTVTLAVSKSLDHSSVAGGTKSGFTPRGNQVTHHSSSHIRPNNTVSPSTAGLAGKKSDMTNVASSLEPAANVEPTDSEISLAERHQGIQWSLKAQEGVVAYRLPDGLSDGMSLHNKLQKLMKTDTIYLNDRRFWTALESRFKSLRKQNFEQNMERLRQMQQQHEQGLISQGLMPYTTEEAIKRLADEQNEQRRTRTTSKPNPDKTSRASEKEFYLYSQLSNKAMNASLAAGIEFEENPRSDGGELEAFETDDVHPRLHQIFADHQFQTVSGKELGEKLEHELHQAQTRVKTIFPKTNQRDMIRQELDAVKTSEGLYAYSNRLAKQTLQ